MNRIKREEGQGLVEYALVLVLIAIVILVVLGLVGEEVRCVFAKTVAGLGGQTLTCSGTEYVVNGFGVSVGGGPAECTVTATNVEVTVYIDGELAEAGTPVSGTGTASGGGTGSGSGTTNDSGVATIPSIASSGAACGGIMTVEVGGNAHSVSYSQ
jgi:pilus assembly protein Flp/PilA